MVTEVLGFSLILPFLPFYAQKFGATPFTIGLIFASFSLFQFISAPIMGKLSDSFGRKPLLIFSQFSTFIGYIVLGFSNTLWMIFLSRIIDGLLGSNFTIAQAYISDISSKKDRTKALGLSGAAFGFGFLIGPGIGGYLASFNYSLPAFLAAGFSFLTIVLTYFFLPETITKRENLKLNMKIFEFDHYGKYFSKKKLFKKFLIFFSYVLNHSIFVSNWALFAERQLSFGTTEVGFTLTYIGFISIFIRTVLLSKMIDKLGENKLQLFGLISAFLGTFSMGFIDTTWLFVISITFFAFGSGISRPALLGSISREGSVKEQGLLMGITGSIMSFSQIIGPLIGGYLLNNFFPGTIGLVGSFILMCGIILLLSSKKNLANKI